MIGVLVVILLVAFGVLALLFDMSALVLLSCAAIPIFLWLLRRPAHMAGACVALHAWPLVTLGGAAGITPFKLSIVVLAGLTANKLYREEFVSITWPLVGSLLFILVVKLISDISATYGGHFSSLYEFLGTLLLILMLTQLIRSMEDMRAMAIPIVLNLIALGLYVAFFESGGEPGSQYVRFDGPTGNANALAIAVLGPLPLAFAVAFDGSSRRLIRIVGVAAVVFGIYSMLGTASRAGAGGTVLAFMVLGLTLGRTFRVRLMMIAAVAVILPTAWYFSPATMTYRLTATITEADETSINSGPKVGLSERDEHLSMALDMIPESPWIGHGATGFVMRRTMLGMTRTWAHSSVLGLTVAHGVPAALLYLFLLLGSIYVAWLNRRRLTGSNHILMCGLLSSLCGIVAASMMFTGQFRPRLWAFVALSWIIHHRLSRDAAPAPLQPSAPTEPPTPLAPIATRPQLQLYKGH